MSTLSSLRSFRDRFKKNPPTTFVLTAHLFRRFFDNEFVSESGESHLGFIQILVLLGLPGVFYVLYSFTPYDFIAQIAPNLFDPYSMKDELGFVSIAMMIVGLVTILEWDALFLDRLDFLTLVPLPLNVRRLFAAKVAALLLFLSSVTIAVGGAGTILYPLVASVARHVSFFGLCWWMIVHGLSVAAASAFIFLLILALRGLLVNTLGYRWSDVISPYLQGALIAGFLVVGFLLPQVIEDMPTLLPTGSILIRILPPVWFLGLYRAMLGYSDPVYFFLTRRALEGLGWVGAISALTYLASYRHHFKRTLDVAQPAASEPWLLTQQLRRMARMVFLRKSLERASFAFVFDTLRGSRKHRLLLSAYTGVGAAVVLESLAALLAHGTGLFDRMAILLSVPLLLSFFVISGLRIVFEVPAEIEARWVFQLTENKTSAELTSGVRKAMMVAGFVPILTLLVPVWVLHLNFWQAAAAFLLDCLLATPAGGSHAVELPENSFHLLLPRHPVPNHDPVGALCWAAFTSYAYALATAEAWALHHPAPLMVFLVLLLVLLGGIENP